MRTSSETTKSCGASQPWMLEAPAGQQINVSLLDFGLQRAAGGVKERAGTSQQHCSQPYGQIVDKASSRNISICGLGEERNVVVYQSVSNSILLTLNLLRDADDNDNERALIGFKG